MNIYEDICYRKESEIDNAFKYLDALDKEIKDLTFQASTIKYDKNIKERKFNIFKFLSKNVEKEKTVKEKRKLLRSGTYNKDGYIFKIRLYNVSDEISNEILYFEFYSNIIYANERRNKQFYTQISDENNAKQYFENMSAVFKILKRRDLMEKLFNSKLEEISLLKDSLINR